MTYEEFKKKYESDLIDGYASEVTRPKLTDDV